MAIKLPSGRTITLGTIATILTIMVAWVNLDGPVPASRQFVKEANAQVLDTTNASLQVVQNRAEDNSCYILNDAWFRHQDNLDRADRTLEREPSDEEARQKRIKALQQIRKVEQRLERLGEACE